MDKSARRQAIRDYKDQTPTPGVFAVRCAPSGEVWVGGSPNLGSHQNRVWLQLKTGGHPNRAMQAAWNTHGDGAISFEELERIDDESLTPLGRADLIKSRERHWITTLGAAKAAG